MDKPVMSPSFWEELADNNPLGMQLSAADARHWFDLVWLRYSTYRYTKHRRAIINWWSRVSESEIEQARQRAARIVNDEENAKLEARAQAETKLTLVTDHFSRLRERA